MKVLKNMAILVVMFLVPEAVRAATDPTAQGEERVSPAMQESIAKAAEGALKRLGVKLEDVGKDELRMMVRKYISPRIIEEMAKATDAIILLSIFSDAIKSPKEVEKIGIKTEHLRQVAKELGRVVGRHVKPLLEMAKKVVEPPTDPKPEKEAKP